MKTLLLFVPVVGMAACCCPCHECEPECIINPSVYPLTCSGDLILSAEGLYFRAFDGGLEFTSTFASPIPQWKLGARAALTFITCHDGWDLDMRWTYYKGRANGKETGMLTPLWSNFPPPDGGNLLANKINADWQLEVDLLDITLGREFWVSPCLSLHPFIGFRFGWVYQDYDLIQKGGSFGSLVDRLDLDNHFRGAGMRGGLNSTWDLWCGFGLYGKMAMNLIYGRFTVDLLEKTGPKTKIFQSIEKFKAVRPMLDLALGIRWLGLFCNDRFAIGFHLGWEEHIFFNQNQLWQISRFSENVYSQLTGSISLEGLVFGAGFHF